MRYYQEQGSIQYRMEHSPRKEDRSYFDYAVPKAKDRDTTLDL